MTDKTQQNCRYKLCGYRDQTIDYIISKCIKLAQKEYTIRHVWVGKVIHCELCKKFRFDHTNKWYMHNPESVLENDTHKLPWDFKIEMVHLISARRPGLLIIKKKKKKKEKKTCRIVDFAPNILKLKESEEKDTYLDFARKFKKLWNMTATLIPIVISAFGTFTKGLVQLVDLEISGRAETIQTTPLLRSVRTLRRILETCGDLLPIKFQWKIISVSWCEKLKK